MKFLLDVNVGTTVAAALQVRGHDVSRAAVFYPTWTDTDLLDLAVRESRIIVTQDSDFTDLIFSHDAQPPPSLIYIRCQGESQSTIAALVSDVVSNDSLMGHVVVLTPKNVRYRPFPNTGAEND